MFRLFDDVTYMYLPTIRAPLPSPLTGSRRMYSTLLEATKSGPDVLWAGAGGARTARPSRAANSGRDRRDKMRPPGRFLSAVTQAAPETGGARSARSLRWCA